MKVLVIGSGGREHALVWKIRQSPLADTVFCAPGNAGIQELAECVEIPSTDISRLLSFAKTNKIELTVVGPELPLWHGIVDEFTRAGLAIFGPTQEAAKLEGSKGFAKDFMRRNNIPTARYEWFDNLETARNYIWTQEPPLVVKADGLAAGKGAVICKTQSEAQIALEEMMIKRIFGEASKRVIIEEFLSGEEISVLALTDGQTVLPLIPAQDHKAIYDDGVGPNTGGMGAYAPVSFVSPSLLQQIQETIFLPTVRGLAAEGIRYQGILYAGLMLTAAGPQVIEFNARFGDPETQAILPLLDFDLLAALLEVAEGKLLPRKLKIKNQYATCVVMAAGGYPGKYEKGKPINGLAADFGENVMIFHAGTKIVEGQVVTNGGRVLGITAIGDDLTQSIQRAYTVAKQVHFDGAHYRKDIGRNGLKQLNPTGEVS